MINIFRENDPEFNPYPLMKEWLRFFRSIVQEVAELWTIRIVVNESIAEKIGCLNDDDVVITNEADAAVSVSVDTELNNRT